MKNSEIPVIETIKSKDLDPDTIKRAIKAARRIARTGEAHYEFRKTIDQFACWVETEEGFAFWFKIGRASLKGESR